MMNFAFNNDEFGFKMINCVSKMMNFALKMVNFVIKMTNFEGARVQLGGTCYAHGGSDLYLN